MDGVDDRVVLIAGPTASGKSALALAVAERLGGIVINTDSMQVYRDLEIITARPGAAEAGRAPHLLYGHVDAAENYSVGRFVEDARVALAQARAQRRVAIFAGGSGLYFKALTRGLAAIPPIGAEIRSGIRAKLESGGVGALHAELARRDPATAARLNPADRTRVARALEVFETTGRAISDWHRDGLPPLLDEANTVKIFLTPERAELYRRIDVRFDSMLAAGALDEVRALHARRLDPLLPAMKAHGVPWLIRHLAGEMSLDAAAEAGKRDTRHYAKRQFTWFRHQLGDWPRADPHAAFDDIMRAAGR
jgi:tRNA dimethylallyltransferase